MDRIKVSVVLAVRNEERIIENCLNSLMSQRVDSNVEIELLVIDGNSDDRTADIVRRVSESKPEVKYLFNEKRITPVAFNIGLKNASGNFIAIFGAHSEYDDDYIQVCLNEIEAQRVDGCSGMVIPKSVDDDAESELCISIMSSPIGVSGGSFRTRGAGLAESIPYGVFKKEVFTKVGLYDERLIRNQDNDMNARINKAGFKLYISDKTKSYYHPKSKLKPLLNYAELTGKWNAKSIRLGSYTLRLMHFIPFLFVMYLLLAALIGVALLSLIGSKALLALLFIPLVFYVLLLIYFALRTRFKYRMNKLRFIGAVFLFHWRYGWGTLKGFVTKI